MTPIAKVSSKAEMYPRVMIPGRAYPFVSEMKSTIATAPPELQINLDKSKLCLAIYRIHIAAYFLTKLSLSFNLYKILGNISLSTTISAKSIVCLEIFARHEQTCLFN